MQTRWEKRELFVLYLEFFAEMFRLAIYVAFFGIILVNYGVPLHIIRQLYVTYASFQRKVVELVRYRKATANLHARYRSQMTIC
jgi:E3 ubiquitin-protein ligase synoviolin